VWIESQTESHTEADDRYTHATTVGVSNNTDSDIQLSR